ncbi:MAG: hypothetical protein EA383_02340 [Spirochaetaceae bacterium]|nr:MAG: hypothetical protein EA383_02340 [Spirochaetaceae bacterium]
MFSEPGKYAVDFSIVRKDSIYHLFHIRGNRGVFVGSHNNGSEEDIGHATSDNLVVWDRHAPVVPRGTIGSWEESKVFAPDVLEKDGLYYMFYTGVTRYVVQSIGLATSRDLFNWEKHPGNPLVVPGTWSNWKEQAENDQPAHCRDGMVFLDSRSGHYVMYYTASMGDKRACIGTAFSENLIDWKDTGPTFIEDDCTYNRMESPFVFEENGTFYMFYSGKGKRSDHWEICYLRSDSPTGPWEKPPNHTLLEDWGCASQQPIFDGQRYMLFILYEKVRTAFHRGKVSDPVRMSFAKDGTVRLEEHVSTSVPRRKATFSRFYSFDRTEDPVGVRSISITASLHLDSELLVSDVSCVDLSCCVTVRIQGDEAGISFRLDERGDSGYFVTLVPKSKKIRFFKKIVTGSFDGSFAKQSQFGSELIHENGEELIQERTLTRIAEEGPYELKVLAKREFFEVYLDGELVIVRADYDFASGHLGLFACGQAQFTKCELDHLDLHAEHFWGKTKD